MKPNGTAQREAFVQGVFDRIAGRYDLLNRIISLRLDTVWRRQAIRALGLSRPDSWILDLGTGTGDLALDACSAIGNGGRVLGLDVSWPMLVHAERKKLRHPAGSMLRCVLGSAIKAPFRDRCFDAAMSAFVLRNVADLSQFFAEAYRVVKPGGKLATLEMFPPPRGIFSSLYWVYFGWLMPWLGAGLAGDREAYRYLADSVRNFLSPEALTQKIQKIGFRDVRERRYLHGAVCLHVATRP